MRKTKASNELLLTSIAALMAAGLTLAGCAATEEEPTSEPSTSGDQEASVQGGELVMYNDNPQWEEAWTLAGAEMEQLTGWSIKPTSLPTTTAYTQTVLTSLPTDSTGDIIKWWSGKMVQGLAATGQLQDLTEVWDQSVADGYLNDDLREFYTLDGKVYAMPFIRSYWVIYYSKSAFADAGISSTPTTWDELRQNMETLAGNGQQFCTGQGDGWPSFVPFQMFMGAISPDFYTKLTNNEANWTDPELATAMNEWKDWIDNGWMTAADTKLFDCPALMKAGSVSMASGGTWQNGEYRDAGMTDEDYGAFLIPRVGAGPPVVFIEGGAIAVPKNAPNGSGALEGLRAWLAPEVQEIWAPLVGDASPNSSVANTDPVINDVSNAISDSNATVLNRYYESLPPNLVQSTIETFGGFMVEPNVEQAIRDLQAQAETEWAAWEANPTIG